AEADAAREDGAAGRGEGRVDVPAARPLAAGHRHRLSEESHRLRRQDALAVVRAAVEQHAHEDGQVVGRREEAGVPGDATEAVAARVVDLAGEPGPVALLGGGGPL